MTIPRNLARLSVASIVLPPCSRRLISTRPDISGTDLTCRRIVVHEAHRLCASDEPTPPVPEAPAPRSRQADETAATLPNRSYIFPMLPERCHDRKGRVRSAGEIE